MPQQPAPLNFAALAESMAVFQRHYTEAMQRLARQMGAVLAGLYGAQFGRRWTQDEIERAFAESLRRSLERRAQAQQRAQRRRQLWLLAGIYLAAFAAAAIAWIP